MAHPAQLRAPGRGPRRSAAFTLIEILAVVAILAMMASFVIPNIGTLSRHAIREQAAGLASQLELARQRSVVTGIPHRLFIDLDAAAYRLEWLVADEAASGEPPPDEPPAEDLLGSSFIDLAAPPPAQRAFHPLPGAFGRFTYLPEALAFAGIETPGGRIERGETFVAFERDGTSAYTAIVLEGEDGRTVTLEVLPLAEIVRIHHETP